MSVKPKIPEEARRYLVYMGIEWHALLLQQHRVRRARDLPEPVISELGASYLSCPEAALLWPDPSAEVQAFSQSESRVLRVDMILCEQHASQVVVE